MQSASSAMSSVGMSNPWGYYFIDGQMVPKTEEQYYHDITLERLGKIEERLKALEEKGQKGEDLLTRFRELREEVAKIPVHISESESVRIGKLWDTIEAELEAEAKTNG